MEEVDCKWECVFNGNMFLKNGRDGSLSSEIGVACEFPPREDDTLFGCVGEWGAGLAINN